MSCRTGAGDEVIDSGAAIGPPPGVGHEVSVSGAAFRYYFEIGARGSPGEHL